MQDPGLISQGRSMKAQFPEHEHLKCPRCDSTNTKFCYYNNYNLSQPRHFCKNCRRYWTKGGTLRNIPVGGGSRKNTKRAAKSKSKQPTSASASPSPSSSSTLPSLPKPDPDDNLAGIYNPDMDSDQRLLDINGTFSSLLATNGHFAPLSFEPMSSRIQKMPQGLNMMGGPVGESFSKNLWGVQDFSDNAGGIGNPPLELQNNESESFLPLPRDSSCWAGSGWPDLAIYTPGNNLHLTGIENVGIDREE